MRKIEIGIVLIFGVLIAKAIQKIFGNCILLKTAPIAVLSEQNSSVSVNTPASMGDVLPPKRQTVVDRLKRRFELYRRHQSACLPRYEQAANGLYEAQRQETLLLKQRFLESKAKKAKNNKSDHHRTYKESSADGAKTQLHNKPLKRPAEDSVANSASDCPNSEDSEKPAKINRTEPLQDKTTASDLQTQSQQNHPSFSVQIVQQFSNTSHNQQSQTVQTQVTVQTLSKPLNSPLPQTSQTIVSNQKAQEVKSNQKDQTLGPQSVSNVVATANNVECKQEKDTGQTSDLCQFKNNRASNSSGGGDRLSDTFPSLGFTDDSGDDVIHPDILKDLIDDVFTNSGDIMKDFNFEDSVGSMKDQEDATKDIIDLVKGPSPTQLRTFQTDNLSFVNTQVNQQHQNGLFRNMSSNNDTTIGVMSTTTSTSVTSAATFYNTSSQRLPSYGNSALPLPSGLGLDFKLTEPSPAALTLKQMAEQHQNMQQKQQQQQQQLGASTLSSRPSPFNQDTYNAHINSLRSANYLNGSNSGMTNSSPKAPNTATNIFNSFDRRMSNFPGSETMTAFSANCEPISPNIFEAEMRARTSVAMSESDHVKQQRLQMESSCHTIDQQKPPVYNTTRPLTHYSESSTIRRQNPVNNNQQIHQRPSGRQFHNNAEMRLQMTQSQHVHPGQHSTQQLQQNAHDVKQQPQHMVQNHPNMYGNYSAQQPVSNPTFHGSMSQSLSYSPQFSNPTMNRTPPEYKAQQSNLATENLHLVEQLNNPQVMFNNTAKHKYTKQQRPPNVTITPDGSAISSSGEWRHRIISQQNNQLRMNSFSHQETYGSVMRNDHLNSAVHPSPMYNQYRVPSNQILTGNRMARPSMMPANQMLVQQRQRVPVLQQRSRNPSMVELDHHSSLGINNSALSQTNMMGPVYTNQQDINRQDGSQINLDFLDNIESSASDLLNFDQVIQGGGSHFPLLDDMGILDK